MRIGGCPTRAGARYGDSEGRTCLEDRLAMSHRMDFPLLGLDCAVEEGGALGYGTRGTLGHRDSQLDPFDLITKNWPGHDEMTATTGDDCDRVNCVPRYPRESYAGGATNTPTRVRTIAAVTGHLM